ncbi:oxidoreductase [Nocardioides nanhaiensis]|uniref:SDR family NAD(P)-dependent oxidoreductase n=1 Tax=Nocardioides nanhaiensis TaxID=1476871 RepID=A0ABP8VR78_9ACTN
MSGAGPWTRSPLPDLAGRTALVTGPSVGGIGFHTALELARAGARVVLAGRTTAKLDDAAHVIRHEVPGAQLERLELDLASLESVRHAAEHAGTLGPLHLLVNNAGVMGTPLRRTRDGFELQLATNHLGPFLLTGLLLPRLVAGAEATGIDSRVVTVSSLFHRTARSAPLGDPRVPGRYQKWNAYAQSKLANLLFTFELERRLRESGAPVRATAAHPGFAGTHLAANGQYGRASGGVASVLDGAIRAVSQSPAAGAWPTLMAATADLPGGTFCGPGGLGELSGVAQVVTAGSRAQDPVAQRALWEVSERAVGLRWP